MMTTYIVTYDLPKPGTNYPEPYKRIKSYRSWAHDHRVVVGNRDGAICGTG